MFLISYLSALIAVSAQSPYVNMVTWDGDAATTYQMVLTNDPVMGGQSYSNYTVSDSLLNWQGDCKIVPSLDAPGFCKIETNKSPKFPDVSEYTHLGIRIASQIPYTGWRVCFEGDNNPNDFVCYKADFSLTDSTDFQEVYVPWTSFSSDWDPATGDAVETCAQNPKVCPTAETLGSIINLSLWAEGVEGEFEVAVDWVRAANITSATAKAAKRTDAGVFVVV
jgi:hypothetical protein